MNWFRTQGELGAVAAQPKAPPQKTALAVRMSQLPPLPDRPPNEDIVAGRVTSKKG